MLARDSSSLPEATAARLNARLLGYAALDLIGVATFVMGIVPLLDGMPLFLFPATTGQAVAFVIAGLALGAFATFRMLRDILSLARGDAAGR